jgi:hypothetical protein
MCFDDAQLLGVPTGQFSHQPPRKSFSHGNGGLGTQRAEQLRDVVFGDQARTRVWPSR